MNEPKSIHIKGARVHNLRNIEVEIPHDTLTVITGLSGSGKSTLAFDTIFAEGQRRYVESLSAYARQFLGKIDKPDVDLITGIAPAIAIEQKVNTRNPRSTVGTTTEIYDYLKLLFARIGRTFSPVSGREVKCYDVDDVAQYVLALGQGAKALVAAPLVAAEGQGVIEKLTLLMGDGIQRVQYDGRTRFIEELLPELDPAVRPDELSVIVDRLRVASDEEFATRLRDSVARAFAYGDGVCRILTDERAEEFSSRFEADGIAFEQPTEHLFSFNNPLGACPRCEGYGKIIGFDCGPGNILLDAWCRKHIARPYDTNGAWGATGRVHEELLAKLLSDPYFERQPPKSTGREHFNLDWLESQLTEFGTLEPADVQATLVMLTARTITDAIKKFAGRTEEIYLCGGGALNGALAQCIRECAGEAIYVRSTSALGVDPMHVEAMAFAWLAWAFLQKKPGNLPEVTNASGARLLGALYPH